MCQDDIFYATAVVDALIMVRLVCVLELNVYFWFFLFFI